MSREGRDQAGKLLAAASSSASSTEGLTQLGAIQESAATAVAAVGSVARGFQPDVPGSLPAGVQAFNSSLPGRFPAPLSDGVYSGVCHLFPACSYPNCSHAARIHASVTDAASMARLSYYAGPRPSPGLPALVGAVSNEDLVAAGMSRDQILFGEEHRVGEPQRHRYCDRCAKNRDCDRENKCLIQNNNVYAVVEPRAQLLECIRKYNQALPQQRPSESELAIALYTTYLYGPINRVLRSQGLPSVAVLELVMAVTAKLFNLFPRCDVVSTPKFRIEANSSWISAQLDPNKQHVGQKLHFPAFTSTHMNAASLPGMDKDMKAGKFGEVKSPVLLVFYGRIKCIDTNMCPHLRYFPHEEEFILPPNLSAVVIWIAKPSKSPELFGDINGLDHFDVYHLECDTDSWMVLDDLSASMKQ